jgi:hypothetical protein
MNYDPQLYRINSQDILRGKPFSLRLTKIIIAMSKFIYENKWQGACHAVSALMYVLCSEQQMLVTLYIGEASFNQIAFNHSWIEIDNEVYDIAIMSTLDERFKFAPTVRGFDLELKKPTQLFYGVSTGLVDDEPTKIVKQIGFVKFMDSFPSHPKGLWGFIEILQGKISINSDINSLRSKYESVQWVPRI